MAGTVWGEEDLLPLAKVEVLSLKGGASQMVMAKGSFCIVLGVRVTKDGLEVGSPRTFNCGPTRLVGLQVLGHKILLVPQKGPLRMWDLQQGAATVDLEADGSHYANYGLSLSPSGSLLVLLQCVAAYQDHLLLREPSRLLLATLDSLEVLKEKMLDIPGQADTLEVARMVRSQARDSLEQDFQCSGEAVVCRRDWWRCVGLRARRKGEDARLEDVLEHCEIVIR